MHQCSQSEDDAKFCILLENLCYKSCTSDDITFLCKCIARTHKHEPKWSDSKFHNISVICMYNATHDKLNGLGSVRFVKEISQN